LILPRPDLHLWPYGFNYQSSRFSKILADKSLFLIETLYRHDWRPTGKSTRPPLTKEQVIENAQSYASQAFKILDKR
jgi:tyrosyl-tRNA synthetase